MNDAEMSAADRLFTMADRIADLTRERDEAIGWANERLHNWSVTTEALNEAEARVQVLTEALTAIAEMDDTRLLTTYSARVIARAALAPQSTEPKP